MDSMHLNSIETTAFHDSTRGNQADAFRWIADSHHDKTVCLTFDSLAVSSFIAMLLRQISCSIATWDKQPRKSSRD